MVFRTPLSKLFTTDEEVIAAVSDITPLLAISVFFNGIQPILSGKIRIASVCFIFDMLLTSNGDNYL